MASSHVVTSFQGLSAIVTGGSSGLGLAAVERLSKLGCIVAIIDLNGPKQLPNNTYFIKADVASEHDIVEALKIVEQRSKKLDILINCAGIIDESLTFDTHTNTPHSLDMFERIYKVNVTGTFNVIRLFCSMFNRNHPNENKQRGVIINAASIMSYDGIRKWVAYSSSKSAVAGMTLPLARDLAPMGVRVMAIAPSFADTPLLASYPKDIVDMFVDQVQFPKRLVTGEEFAHLVQSIVENPMLNGEVIRLDGAIRSSCQID